MKYFIEAFANKVMKFWISFIFLLIFVMQSNAAKLDLNDMPLIVSTSVPPNIVVSMDDSGSMAWGYMPDAVASDWREIYYRSAYHNKIYYDPIVTYIAPSDAVGTSLADADYTDAVHGYFYDVAYQVRINLSTDFVGIYDHYYNDSTPDLLGAEESALSCLTGPGDPCDPQPAYYYEFDDDFFALEGEEIELKEQRVKKAHRSKRRDLKGKHKARRAIDAAYPTPYENSTSRAGGEDMYGLSRLGSAGIAGGGIKKARGKKKPNRKHATAEKDVDGKYF